MGLNKTEGEILGNLGRGTPVPVQKWANVYDMVTVASQAAGQEFIKRGASEPVRLGEANILVQEYHLFSKVIWTFWLPIKGIDQYYNYTFDLNEQALGELVASGLWPAVYAMPAGMRAN